MRASARLRETTLDGRVMGRNLTNRSSLARCDSVGESRSVVLVVAGHC